MTHSHSSSYWQRKIYRNIAASICWLLLGLSAIIILLLSGSAKQPYAVGAILLVAEVYLFARRRYARRCFKRSLLDEQLYQRAHERDVQRARQAEEARTEAGQRAERAEEDSIRIEGKVFKHLPKTYAGSYQVPEGITQIGSRAFQGCRGLIRLVLPSTLEQIGFNAFKGCSALMHLELPESVRIVVPGAFEGCTSLHLPICNSRYFAFMPKAYQGAYQLPESIEEVAPDAFEGCSGITSPVCNARLFAFMPRSAEGRYALPDGIEKVADGAFAGCLLTSVVLPDSLRIIGSGAFRGCAGLAEVEWGAGVEEIGSEAFAECTSLQDAVLPMSVCFFGDDPFVGCTGLKRFVVRQADDPVDVLAMLWNCPALEEVEIPEDWGGTLKEDWEEYLGEYGCDDDLLYDDDDLFCFDDEYDGPEDDDDSDPDDTCESPDSGSAADSVESDFSVCFPCLRRLVFYGRNSVKVYEGPQIKQWIDFRPYIDDID